VCAARPTKIVTKYNATSAIPTRLFLFVIWNVLQGVTFLRPVASKTCNRTHLNPRMPCDIIVCMTTNTNKSCWIITSSGRTFEDRRHNIVTLTRFFGKAGG